MISPPQLPDNNTSIGVRLAAAGGGLLLGALLGGLIAYNLTASWYAGQSRIDDGGVAPGLGAGMILILSYVAGVVGGGAIGGCLLGWLVGGSRTRSAAIVLAACGYVGTVICLMGAAAWWTRAQSAVDRDMAFVHARDTRRQAEMNAADAARASANPQQPGSDPQVTRPAPPGTLPQATDPVPGDDQQTGAETQRGAETTADVNSEYGELSYPNAAETRIASPSPRPQIPAAVVLQMTTDPLRTVIAYYEIRLQVIRESPTEYLGSGKRPGDGAAAIVRVHQGDAGYVYIEMSAG